MDTLMESACAHQLETALKTTQSKIFHWRLMVLSTSTLLIFLEVVAWYLQGLCQSFKLSGVKKAKSSSTATQFSLHILHLKITFKYYYLLQKRCKNGTMLYRGGKLAPTGKITVFNAFLMSSAPPSRKVNQPSFPGKHYNIDLSHEIMMVLMGSYSLWGQQSSF